MSFSSPLPYPPHNTLKRPVTQASDTPLGAPHCTPWSMHLPPLLGVSSWRVKTASHSSSWPQKLTQARHRALTPHKVTEGARGPRMLRRMLRVSPATQRKPRDLATPESAVTSPGRFVECQGQKPDGNFCQPLWKFPVTEMVSGDNILKAHKVQKYLWRWTFRASETGSYNPTKKSEVFYSVDHWETIRFKNTNNFFKHITEIWPFSLKH